MLGRALGHIPDIPDPRDYDFGRFGVSSRSPSSASLVAHEPAVYDQGRTSSCVAQAMAGAIEILERRAAFKANLKGLDFPAPATPSRLSIYINSRILHAGGPAIFDNGTYLRTAAAGLRDKGCCDEQYHPFSQFPWKVNRRPPLRAVMRAHARSGGEYARINDRGEDRIRAIKGAIAAGYPVCFGTRVTSDFLGSRGPGIVDRPSLQSKFAGGHAMCIVGYNSLGLFDIRNSWGAGWRDNGHCRMTEDYLRWEFSTDFQIMRGWARLKEMSA